MASKNISGSWSPANPPSPGSLASVYDDYTDSQVVEAHLLGVGGMLGSSVDAISTTWPGLPTPVLTVKLTGESATATLRRHKSACLLAVAQHPITG